jgi:hypothetical protein
MTPIPAPSAKENTTTTWTSDSWLRMRAVACTPFSRGMRQSSAPHPVASTALSKVLLVLLR